MLSHFVLECEHSQVKPAVPLVLLVRNEQFTWTRVYSPSSLLQKWCWWIRRPWQLIVAISWEGLGRGRDEVIDLVYTWGTGERRLTSNGFRRDVGYFLRTVDLLIDCSSSSRETIGRQTVRMYFFYPSSFGRWVSWVNCNLSMVRSCLSHHRSKKSVLPVHSSRMGVLPMGFCLLQFLCVKCTHGWMYEAQLIIITNRLTTT